MKSPISIAILGASGYTGEELVRICVRHPGMKVTAVTSRQWKGKTLEETLGIRGPAGAFRVAADHRIRLLVVAALLITVQVKPTSKVLIQVMALLLFNLYL